MTVTHRRISDRANTPMIGAGWHMHLDILAAKASGKPVPPFWEGWQRLREEYDQRFAA